MVPNETKIVKKKKKGTNGFSKVMLFKGVAHNILILWEKINV